MTLIDTIVTRLKRVPEAGGTMFDNTMTTSAGQLVGTPEYMSPEQLTLPSHELDTRVDVYALGIILYECMAGRVPFEGDTFMGVLTQHLSADPPPIVEINPRFDSPEVRRVERSGN